MVRAAAGDDAEPIHSYLCGHAVLDRRTYGFYDRHLWSYCAAEGQSRER